MPFIKHITSRRQSGLLFYCSLIFVATILITFVLVDLIYPFSESVISGDPWWRHNRRIVIVTVIDNVYSSDVATVNRKDRSFEPVNNISTSSDYFKEMSVRNKVSYAEKYKFELAIKGVKDWDREASWANIPALSEAMNEYPISDWLWWIDSNLFISNPSISLFNVLRNIKLSSDYGNKEMLIGYDCDGLNVASFFIRNSPWGRRFLTSVYNPELFRDFKDEETVMQILIDLEVIEIGLKILFVPLRTLNALPLNRNCSNDDKFKWHKDDFIVNFTGCEKVQKECDKRFNEVMRNF